MSLADRSQTERDARAELIAWRDALHLKNKDAADRLGLSYTGFLNQLYGHRPVSKQTLLLIRADKERHS